MEEQGEEEEGCGHTDGVRLCLSGWCQVRDWPIWVLEHELLHDAGSARGAGAWEGAFYSQ